MKKIYLIICVIMFAVFQAQNISFYDQNLKNKILSSNPNNQVAKNISGNFFAIDANSDGQISTTEASQVSYLDVSNSSISNTLGLTSFTNLVTLKINNNSLTSTLNLSSITTLKNIECQNNVLSILTLDNPISVNVANNHLHTFNTTYGATGLVYLNISNNYFTSFTIDYPSLVDFSANGNPMTQMYFTQASPAGFVLNPVTQVETLTFSSYGYTPPSFTIANFPNLKYLHGSIEPINGLLLENLPSLSYSTISSQKITVKNINPSIDINGLSFNIDEFHLQGTSNTANLNYQAIRAKKYYFEDLTTVTDLNFYVDEDATDVHFSNLPILNNLKFGTNSSNPNACIASVDLSTIPSLKNFEINNLRYGSMNFSNLNLLKKITLNGTSCNPSNSVLNISNLPQLEEIIIKDRYLKTLNINNLNSLKSIALNNISCQSITLSSLPQLISFLMDSNSNATNTLTSLDFNNLPSLQSIELLRPFVNAVTFNNLPNFKTFKVEDPYSVYSSSDISTSYNFSNLPLLESITLNNSKVIPLTLNNLPNLKNLTIKKTYFGTGYTFQNLPLLENITIEAPQISGPGTIINLSDLAFNNLPAVKSIALKDFYSLNTLNFGNTNTTLENFSMKSEIATYGNFTSFTFNDFPQLKTLQFNRKLTNLQLTNLPQLHTLNVSSNNFTTLNIGNLPALQNFTSNYNNYTSGQYNINFTNLPVLKKVNVSYNNGYLKKVDLSQAPQLEELQFVASNSGNPQTLDYINLKNGNPNLLVLNTEYIKNICVDDDSERALVQSLDTSLANTIFTSYCTLAPAGSIYKVTGTVSYDYNNNGCDSSDPKFPYLKFGINSGGVSSVYTANQTGIFNIPLQAGNHIITPILENPTYYNVSPTNFTADFPTQASPLTQNLCFTPNGTHNDLEVVIIPINAAAPGFAAKYKIVYKNKGNVAQSGTLSFNYNDDLMNYSSSTLAPNSQSTGLLNWNFTNLTPFETREITITFTLNTPTQTPALNGGDILHYTAQINAGTDETPLDNIFTLNQTVVNSFDPNDKTCLEGASITQAQVGDYVHYLIRFENTGTANAQNIVVKDVIDTSKFDLSSLVALNGSHNFVTRITNPNTVEFIFENIQLPFNNATNDGYVSFKIKTKSTLNLGNSFSNKANIYFDYNHPIITNNYTTIVQNNTTLGTSEINNDKTQFSIYPNPVKDVLFIKSKEKIVKAEIYDVAGRILNSASVTHNSINVSELSKGNYIIKLSTKDKTMTQKFIKN